MDFVSFLFMIILSSCTHMPTRLENMCLIGETGLVGTKHVYCKPCEFVGTHVIISLSILKPVGIKCEVSHICKVVVGL